MRSWRLIAKELAQQADKDKIVQLSLELREAMEEQLASNTIPKPPVRVETEPELQRKIS